MNEMVWLAMALARLAVRAEMLETENAMLKKEIEELKAPAEKPEPLKAVPKPEEPSDVA